MFSKKSTNITPFLTFFPFLPSSLGDSQERDNPWKDLYYREKFPKTQDRSSLAGKLTKSYAEVIFFLFFSFEFCLKVCPSQYLFILCRVNLTLVIKSYFINYQLLEEKKIP